VPVDDCLPSPENDQLYRAIDPDDRDIIALAQSIAIDGVLEPLVITIDNYILSGHRRHAAAKIAGLSTVPCRIDPIRRMDDIDAFVKRLREFNRQRDKSHDERLRECLVDADPAECYRELLEQRTAKARVKVQPMEIIGTKRRAEISDAKAQMVAAIQQAVEGLRDYWPVSIRKIHYKLVDPQLAARPLKHTSKPDSAYQNTQDDYKNCLTDLALRMRFAGLIPWER
jgi:ParB-like chromosome segregation protein Spo0J